MTQGRRRRPGVTACAWVCASVALASSLIWTVSGWSWRLDLLANLGAQMLLGCVVLGLVVAATRRWRALGMVVVACLLHVVPLVQHRAAFFPRPLAAAKPGDPLAVRVLHYNDSGLSDPAQVYALMERSGADVLSILSPPVQMQFQVINARGLEDTYPGKLTRVWKPDGNGIDTLVSAGFVVSRWPMTRFDGSMLGPMADRFIAARVERPGGPFMLIAFHPRSPRTAARWEEGNAVTDALVELAIVMRGQGVPVVVVGDFNSTPTGWRSRRMCSAADLRHAKPLLSATGTYPDVLPVDLRTRRKSGVSAVWPLSIAIDDALVSPDIEVLGWEAGTRLRSEHRPVRIDLLIPEAQRTRGD